MIHFIKINIIIHLQNQNIKIIILLLKTLNKKYFKMLRVYLLIIYYGNFQKEEWPDMNQNFKQH
jgi:hypothetical protein